MTVTERSDARTIVAAPLALAFSLLVSLEVSEAPPASPEGGAQPRGPLDEVLGVRTAPGALVIDVDAGSPAEQAGLSVCDLIAGFDRQEYVTREVTLGTARR